MSLNMKMASGLCSLRVYVDTQDTTTRFPVLDYRFRANADTAFYTELTTRGAQLRKLAWNQHGHRVYEFASYEYLESPGLSRLMYWEALWGAILIYEAGETLELVAAPNESGDSSLSFARDQVREMAFQFAP